MTYSRDTRYGEPRSGGDEVVRDARGHNRTRRQPLPQRRSPSLAEGAQVVSVSVPVSDQDQAREFYVDALGFELLVDNSGREGMCWIEVAPVGSANSLMLVSWEDSVLPGMYRVIVVATEDILAFHEDLVAKGVFFGCRPRSRSTERKLCSATLTAMRSCSGSVRRSPRGSKPRGSGDAET